MIYFLYKVIKPSKEILLNFDKIVHPYFQKQNKIEEANLQLSSLRDWLLPILMNGEVSVASTSSATKDGCDFEERKLDMVEEPGIRNLSLQEKKLPPLVHKSCKK